VSHAIYDYRSIVSMLHTGSYLAGLASVISAGCDDSCAPPMSANT
jgi:hypothetical protein